MCDIPENLQIIKRDPSPLTTTSEEKSPNSIKAKLNLHVKRRLQDVNQSSEEGKASRFSKPPDTDIKQDKPKIETPIKRKRPYHKRTDKNKTINSTTTTTLETSLTAVAGTSVGIATTTTPQRKYKHKIKQIITTATESKQEHIISNKAEEQALANHQNTSTTTGAISAGDDEEGGNEHDLKAGREKEKSLDVLAMVLSVKKRALMQNPDVQNFLKDIMEVIKS